MYVCVCVCVSKLYTVDYHPVVALYKLTIIATANCTLNHPNSTQTSSPLHAFCCPGLAGAMDSMILGLCISTYSFMYTVFLGFLAV